MFAITCLDKPDSLALRQATRPAHLEYAAQHHVAFGGPLLDGGGSPFGSMLVVEANSKEEAERFAAADPYAQAGLFSSVTIHGFRAVFRDGVLV